MVAVGAIKGLFRNSKGNVPTDEVLASLGVTEAPRIPDWLLAWQRAEVDTARPASPSPAPPGTPERGAQPPAERVPDLP